MRRTLVVALLTGLAALSFATPASAVPSLTTSNLAQANGADIVKVGWDDRDWRKHRHYRYAYRYRPYGTYGYYPYYRPYYRPYAYYGGWPYWYGRPGISFGFAF